MLNYCLSSTLLFSYCSVPYLLSFLLGILSIYIYNKLDNKVLRIVFARNLDLYWTLTNLDADKSLDNLYDEQYETFLITRENNHIYELFKKLVINQKAHRGNFLDGQFFFIYQLVSIFFFDFINNFLWNCLTMFNEEDTEDTQDKHNWAINEE